MKGKYEVNEYIGVPVTTNQSGAYVVDLPDSEVRFHSWRTGKHTKGQLKQLGQVFLTENNLAIAVIATQPIAFKDRHEYTPMQRFTSAFINDTDLKRLKQLLETK
ncbi:hypothetical protein LOSG293_420090 [Secundilactobacillus oryzae JCM 18671]|uniref:DUF7671 domain-containing protein n=1 Tax=Secundilactobacillus oryzae JCM 18671 TaxID=1291743 RepID=A0A081BKQ5_9LACO|nr:hypothetical protein [Secundilactobacillus oryzae]GAK48623.1 hypothetical protein LOSG293_420090 [Secundilactobacillus oryzae JCM 18671]